MTDDRLYPLRPFTAAEVDHLIAFECAPYPVELLMPQQHRMEPTCWCKPFHIGDKAEAVVVQADHAQYRDLTSDDVPGVRTLVDGRRVTDAAAWADVTRRVIGAP